MIESKKFAGGGLNKDVEESFLKPNEYDDALNIRITDRLNNEDGVVSNVKGNTEVVFNGLYGSGSTNKCIGNFANEQTGKYYSFIWNSAGYHTITEFDPFANTITKVLQSKTDTSGADILNFQEYELINGVSMVETDLLYWTDGYNPPRGISISKAKTGNYYLTDESISLAKPPPQQLITAQYADGPVDTTSSNRLKNQLFQFRYLYIYEDGSRSAWSSCSKLPLPQFEINSATDTRAYKNNNIKIAFNAGTKYVKSIEIAAQVKGVATVGNTQDWFSILTVDRLDVINPVNNQYSYNPIDNTAIFTFYNDGLYQSVDVLEADLQYDYVPLVSKTLEVVNGNVLVLGNNREGYDNINPNVNLSLTYVTPSTNQIQEVGLSAYGFPEFIGIPTEGDTIIFNWTERAGGNSYTVTFETAGSLYNTVEALGVEIESDTGGSIQFLGVSAGVTPGSYRLNLDYVSASLTQISIVYADVSNSVASYKTNSRYQLGLVYYDKFNRSSYVQTNDSFIVSTDSWGETQGKAPVINWQINHSAPLWATKYQWVRTEQLTHKKFLYWVATQATVNATNPDIYDLNISTLVTYGNQNPNSILNYDFSEGDRCTVHRQDLTWVTGYDVAVVGYTQTGNTATLQIQKKGTLTPGALGLLIEIYTPKTRANSATEQFFYEFGEQYSCSGGVHSAASGSFVDGDIYDRNRIYPVNGSKLIEDPNFSDFYVSNYSSNGRANIYAPQAKQLTLPTDIRFSDTYVPNTNINGLSRFYGNAFETYDRVNGSIQKLAVRDNYLMTFQELKTGYIPLEQSIIEDQGGGNPNVAISNKLLNKIRYFYGDYGIGLRPESFARFAGTIYFTDPNRGLVLKLTDSIRPISYIGMDSYFTTKLSSIRSFSNARILGSYDPYNDEYIIAFKLASTTDPSLDQTVAFSESINRWTTFYSYKPDIGGYIFNQYITHKDGRLYKHDTNSVYNRFYGVNSPSTISTSFNASSTTIKTYIGLMTQSSSPWIPISISTSLGQASSLIFDDFSVKEGVYFASFLKDSNSPGGLLNGDDLKGYWIKLNMNNAETSKSTMLGADVRFINSFQGIK